MGKLTAFDEGIHWDTSHGKKYRIERKKERKNERQTERKKERKIDR
jgi:hypothetical protein